MIKLYSPDSITTSIRNSHDNYFITLHTHIAFVSLGLAYIPIGLVYRDSQNNFFIYYIPFITLFQL